MRILFASTGGAGHFQPLVPFADACVRGGHEVLVAGPPSLAGAVDEAGHAFWPFDDPPDAELQAVWSRVPSLPPQEQNALVIGEVFARLDASASLPRLLEACERWRPQVVVRETSEFGSAVAAALAGIPHVRVATGLASVEDLALGMAAPGIDELRRSVGLSADPDAGELRGSPYLTLFPARLEDPDIPAPAQTLRFRDVAWDEPPGELPAWWGESDDPLVYVTFGSVAGGMGMAVHVYATAIEALVDLPVRVLLTVGHGADLDAFVGAPERVHVESWIPQNEVLGHAAAVVCHAGSGSTLGALAAGLPLVAVPLFADQPETARRVAAVGAGVAVAPEAGAMREAVSEVLADRSYRAAAGDIAAELRSQPPTDAALDPLESA